MARHIGDRDPRAALEDAVPGETIVADPTVTHEIEAPVAIATPGVTVVGCNLVLADEANANLVEIGADGVRFRDFVLDGNRANQSGERHSNGILVTGARDVTISSGTIASTSRHGIRISDTATVTSRAPGNTIEVPRGGNADVTVRDVRVDDPRRDGCSVEGPDVSNVTVENVRTVGSTDRGSVEVKDGASDTVVRGCYARDCVYGVAIQDHGEFNTTNVRVLGNTAVACETLLDLQVSHPPEGVVAAGNTGRTLGGTGKGGPGGIHANMVHGLVLANNSIDGVGTAGIVVRDCRDATVAGNVVRGAAAVGIAIDGVANAGVRGNVVSDVDGPGIRCGHDPDGESDGLAVTDNQCTDTAGLRLEGSIDRYLVASNVLDGPIVADPRGEGIVHGNLAETD